VVYGHPLWVAHDFAMKQHCGLVEWFAMSVSVGVNGISEFTESLVVLGVNNGVLAFTEGEVGNGWVVRSNNRSRLARLVSKQEAHRESSPLGPSDEIVGIRDFGLLAASAVAKAKGHGAVDLATYASIEG
jgi:hypothetical protein